SAPHDAVGEGRQLLRPGRRDEEVVLDAQAATALPVDAGLDRQHHSLGKLAGAGLVGIGRLVRPGADTVAERVARLAGVADRSDCVASGAVELSQALAGAAEADDRLVD